MAGKFRRPDCPDCGTRIQYDYSDRPRLVRCKECDRVWFVYPWDFKKVRK